MVQRVPQTHAIQVGPKTQMPHRGFIFIPGEFRDRSVFTAPEENCGVRTLSCVGSSIPIRSRPSLSRPSVSIIVGYSIGPIRLTTIACIISSRGPVRSLSCTPYNAAVSARVASSARRSSSTDFILFCYTGEICKYSNPKYDIVFQGPGRVTIREHLYYSFRRVTRR